jgi:hypothetical protein
MVIEYFKHRRLVAAKAAKPVTEGSGSGTE